MAWYALLFVVAVASSALAWTRLTRRDSRLALVYVGGLAGALLGAKLAYVLAELPWILASPDPVALLVHGKTILGGLIGGYAGVEGGKALVGLRAATGDVFATIVPLGLVFGRLGCTLHGCCQGVPMELGPLSLHDAAGVARFPAAPLEAAFHLAAAIAAIALVRAGRQRGQVFHLYLIAYGVFRIATEAFRDTPKLALGISPYQIVAALLVGLGVERYLARRRSAVPVLSPLDAVPPRGQTTGP